MKRVSMEKLSNTEKRVPILLDLYLSQETLQETMVETDYQYYIVTHNITIHISIYVFYAVIK